MFCLIAKTSFTIVTLLLVMCTKFDQYYVKGTIIELTSSSDCSCPGDGLILDCLVHDGVATLWQGSTFDCASNQIILTHDRFSRQQNQAGGECNDGKIVAYIIGEFNGSYISRLNVTVTEDMNNKTIECAAELLNGVSNSSVSTVTVATGILYVHNIESYIEK